MTPRSRRRYVERFVRERFIQTEARTCLRWTTTVPFGGHTGTGCPSNRSSACSDIHETRSAKSSDRPNPIQSLKHVDFPDGRRLNPFLVTTWAYSNAPFVLALPFERTEAIPRGGQNYAPTGGQKFALSSIPACPAPAVHVGFLHRVGQGWAFGSSTSNPSAVAAELRS